jgi:hypothetical protein
MFQMTARITVSLVAGVALVSPSLFSSILASAFVFRVKSLMFHGNSFTDVEFLNVALPNATSNDNAGDNDTFNDHGTLGQSQPGIHIKPTFLYRQQWNPSAATYTLATLSSNNPAGTVTVTAFLDIKLATSPMYLSYGSLK